MQEYTPYFDRLLFIAKPTIIGEIIDIEPLKSILNTGIFKFFVSDYQIHHNMILEFLIKEKPNLIKIKGAIVYNNQHISVCIDINNDLLFSYNDDFYFNFSNILDELLQQIRMEMYKHHTSKGTLDRIYTDIIDMLQNKNYIDRDRFEESEKTLIQVLNKITNELNRTIYMKEFDRVISSKNNNVVDMTNTVELLENIDTSFKTTDELNEYNKIDKELTESAKTLKLDLKAIRRLDKCKSNKFVLPLYSSSKDDIEKFDKLTRLPFNFLSYNNALFSINLYSTILKIQNKETNPYQQLWNKNKEIYNDVVKYLNDKKKNVNDRLIKINKVYNKLGVQISDMKTSFINRSEKYKNPKMLKFIAVRTETNIKTIREAEKIALRKIDILRNKKFYNSPKDFFYRALRLYLGKTGNDIIADFKVLNIDTEYEYYRATEYLFFLMRLIENRVDKYHTPILPIIKKNDLSIGFENTKILKILTGHMFVHTISLSTKEKTPIKKSDMVQSLPEDDEVY